MTVTHSLRGVAGARARWTAPQRHRRGARPRVFLAALDNSIVNRFCQSSRRRFGTDLTASSGP